MTASEILNVITLVIVIGSVTITLFVYRNARYLAAVVAWNDKREVMLTQIVSEAYAVSSVPDHTNIAFGADDNVMMADVSVNYVMLKEMVAIMQDQEAARKEFSIGLTQSLEDLRRWENTNPVPHRQRGLRSLLPLGAG
jgi:hypothetical protein